MFFLIHFSPYLKQIHLFNLTILGCRDDILCKTAFQERLCYILKQNKLFKTQIKTQVEFDLILKENSLDEKKVNPKGATTSEMF